MSSTNSNEIINQLYIKVDKSVTVTQFSWPQDVGTLFECYYI